MALLLYIQSTDRKGKRKGVFSVDFEFTEDGEQSFQWEMDEALEMAARKQVR